MIERLPPADWRVSADADLRIADDGRILIGGSPLRIIRLSASGSRTVADWLAGDPIGESRSQRRLARRLLDAGLVHPSKAHWGLTPVCFRDVTVVVPVKDDHAGLARLLDVLPDVAVVVVDDGSAEPVVAPDATVIRRDRSGGPGVARMAGLAAVETELVAFLDADVAPGPDFFENLLGHFDDPAVAAVAPRVRSRAGDSALERYEEDFSPLDLGDRAANVGPRRPTSYVPTAALIARRSAIVDVGGFDPGLRYGEDVDLVWRLVAAGDTVRYDPSVEVTHDPRPSMAAWASQRRAYGSGATPLSQRHGSVVAPARCSPWSALAWGLTALRRPVLGAAVAAGSTAALTRKLAGVPEARSEALRIAGWGHLHAGRGLAQAVSRVWWPVAIPLAVVWPRVRPAVVAALLVGPVLEWRAGGRRLGPIRTVMLRIVDQMAYGVGVWQSCLEHRTVEALRPELISGLSTNDSDEAATVTRP